ncbi:MAG TPA: dihydrodipicolinate synthase family protein [Kofleriaceae bacterium]|nr:dihydrodipicolinate synthase family protein [Kofleriaceae bacterium]
MTINWQGIFPAITTPFTADGAVDHDFLAEHSRWMIAAGCTGIIPLGSLGEGATLTFAEKRAVLETVVGAVSVPVVAGIAALSTDDAVALARMAEAAGCRGLMVLPPYVYSTDEREMQAHVSAVIAATRLPCMLYNNPPAYRTDYTPPQIVQLAERHANLAAVKESSGDVRRITALRALAGDRLAIAIGVDDLVVEAVSAGAVAWVAGLVNAFPRESVALFDLARKGDERAAAIYRWMLPLLRMDTVPKFVQLIKLCQERVNMGSARVRAPRLPLEGAELAEAEVTIRAALERRVAV